MNCESIWYLFGIYLVNIITIDQSSILSNVPSSTIGDWIIVIIGYIGEFDRIMPCNHLPDGLLSTAHVLSLNFGVPRFRMGSLKDYSNYSSFMMISF